MAPPPSRGDAYLNDLVSRTDPEHLVVLRRFEGQVVDALVEWMVDGEPFVVRYQVYLRNAQNGPEGEDAGRGHRMKPLTMGEARELIEKHEEAYERKARTGQRR